MTARRQTTLPVRDLLQTSEFWRSALDSLTANVAVLDDQGCIVAVNEAWRQFAAREGAGEDFVGSNYLEASRNAHDHFGDAVANGIDELLDGRRESFEFEYPCHSPTADRWFVLRATRQEGSATPRVVLAHEDVTDRRQAREDALMQAALLDEIDAAVVVTDLDLSVLEWSAGAERLYGWSSEEAVGRPAQDLLLPADAEHPEPQGAVATLEGRWEGEFVARRKDGSTFDAFYRSRMVLDEDGRATAVVGVTLDITSRKESERDLVATRNYLAAVTKSMGEGLYTLDSEGCLTFMNDAAESLLGWSVEQLHGHPVHALFEGPREDGAPLPVEESAIVRAYRDRETVRVEDDLFIRADGTALPVAYTASPFVTSDGVEGCVVVFEDNTARKAKEQIVKRDLEKLAWVGKIREAIAEDRLVLHAQPIIEMQTGTVVQQELLLRMLPPAGSDSEEVIGPGAFLPVAEEYGLITEIDRWVIDRSAELAAEGRSVELNVSGRSISDKSLVDHIRAAIQRTGADPANMVFEITETTLVEDEAAARGFVERLHQLRCKVALDDFGTGYGGFTYLKQLPIDYLKIDIEFVRDLRYSQASRKVVEAVVHLAEGFGLKTVGEGVEDDATLSLLAELGVDYAQGFHIGRPSPLEPINPTRPHKEVGNARRHRRYQRSAPART